MTSVPAAPAARATNFFLATTVRPQTRSHMAASILSLFRGAKDTEQEATSPALTIFTVVTRG